MVSNFTTPRTPCVFTNHQRFETRSDPEVCCTMLTGYHRAWRMIKLLVSYPCEKTKRPRIWFIGLIFLFRQTCYSFDFQRRVVYRHGFTHPSWAAPALGSPGLIWEEKQLKVILLYFTSNVYQKAGEKLYLNWTINAWTHFLLNEEVVVSCFLTNCYFLTNDLI